MGLAGRPLATSQRRTSPAPLAAARATATNRPSGLNPTRRCPADRAVELTGRFAVRDAPERDRPIAGQRGDSPAIRTEGHLQEGRVGCPRTTTARAPGARPFTFRQRNDQRMAVGPRRRQVLPIRTEDQTVHRPGVRLDPPGLLWRCGGWEFRRRRRFGRVEPRAPRACIPGGAWAVEMPSRWSRLRLSSKVRTPPSAYATAMRVPVGLTASCVRLVDRLRELVKFPSGIGFPKPDRHSPRAAVGAAVGRPGPTIATARGDHPPTIGSEQRRPKRQVVYQRWRRALPEPASHTRAVRSSHAVTTYRPSRTELRAEHGPRVRHRGADRLIVGQTPNARLAISPRRQHPTSIGAEDGLVHGRAVKPNVREARRVGQGDPEAQPVRRLPRPRWSGRGSPRRRTRARRQTSRPDPGVADRGPCSGSTTASGFPPRSPRQSLVASRPGRVRRSPRARPREPRGPSRD